MKNGSITSVTLGSALCLLSLLFFSTAVFAAAGGSGGGASFSTVPSMGFGTSQMGGSSRGGSSESPFTNLICNDKGSVTFTKSPLHNLTVTAVPPSGKPFVVQGSWNFHTFTSEEALFNTTGKYNITVDNTTAKFQCPGLHFSCKNIVLSLQNCTSASGEVSALFYLSGAKYDDLLYSFKDNSGRTKLFAKGFSISGNKPQFIQIGKYVFSMEMRGLENVTRLQINHPLCTGKSYRATSVSCSSKS